MYRSHGSANKFYPKVCNNCKLQIKLNKSFLATCVSAQTLANYIEISL